MMRLFLAGLVALPLLAQADIYKCPVPGGGVEFSDRPCAGAASDDANRIELKVSAPAAQDQQKQREQSDRAWEEAHRYHLVEVPQLRIQAAQLMASGDPQRMELGRKILYQAEQAEEAYQELKRARAARAETDKRYGDLLRKLER